MMDYDLRDIPSCHELGKTRNTCEHLFPGRQNQLGLSFFSSVILQIA